MIKKLPLILLILSVFSLISAVIVLLTGSSHSKIYNQMKNSDVVTTIEELKERGNKPFLLYGYIDRDHKTVYDNMISYSEESGESIKTEAPQLKITLKDGTIDLNSGYGLAATNSEERSGTRVLKGIKPGNDITIYGINYSRDEFNGIKGFELYPGNPDQYISFLSSPFNSYMIYVRLLIGVALLLFLLSLLINIKK